MDERVHIRTCTAVYAVIIIAGKECIMYTHTLMRIRAVLTTQLRDETFYDSDRRRVFVRT